MPLPEARDRALGGQEMIGWKGRQNDQMREWHTRKIVDSYGLNTIYGSGLGTLIGSKKFIPSSPHLTNMSRTSQLPTTTVRPFHGQIPRPTVMTQDESMVADRLVQWTQV